MEPFSTSVQDPVLPQDEKLMGRWRGLDLYFGTRKEDTGILFITTKRCLWIPDFEEKNVPSAGVVPGTATGYGVKWDEMMGHGTCMSSDDFESPQILCMMDRDIAEEAAEGKEEYNTTNDVRFVPIQHGEDGSCQDLVERLFNVFNKAAGLSVEEVPAVSAEPVSTGVFSRKRKFDEISKSQEEEAEAQRLREKADSAAEAYIHLEQQEMLDFGEPGSALSPEEMERKLAEWDSKLVITNDLDHYQPKGIAE